MNNKLKLSIQLTSVLAFVIVSGIPESPANAAASGCSQIGDFGTAITCINIEGDHLKITKFRGNFSKVSKVCNWRYRLSLKDLKGKEYAHFNGPTKLGCDDQGEYIVPSISEKKPYTAKPGQACASLYQDGIYLDSACESITP